MQPDFSTSPMQPPVVPNGQLSGNSRHGGRSSNPAPHPGIHKANSTAAIGLRFRCAGTASDPVDAPNNNQQQPQKNPCPPGTRAAGAVKAAEGTGDALAAFNLSAVHIVTAGVLFSAGCLEPTPFEPATCLAGGAGAGSLLGGAGALGYLGYQEVKHNVIPAIKQAITCVPSGG